MCTSTFSQNQSKTWYFDGNKIDFSSGTPIVQPHFSTFPSQFIVNGSYGLSENDLFSVRDHYVYNSSGAVAGTIGFPTTDIPSSCVLVATPQDEDPGSYGGLSSLSIVPVPGSCTQYYIIYFADFEGHCSPHGHHFDLRYSTYDLTSNTLTSVDISPGGISGGIADFFYYEFGDIAVSKLLPNNTRILYAGGAWSSTGAIKKYIISSTGITPDPTNPMLYASTNHSMLHAELDISPDGTMLAWANLDVASTQPDVFVINLDANGNFSSINTYLINSSQSFTGVEFSADNTKLYVGARNVGTSGGIYQIDLLNVNSTFLLSGSADFGNSQLELVTMEKFMLPSPLTY